MDGSAVVTGPLDAAQALSRFPLSGEDPANQLSDGPFHRPVNVAGGGEDISSPGRAHLSFAFTARAWLIRRFDTPVCVGDNTVYAVPEPDVLAQAWVGELREMQLTGRKAEYIVGPAEWIASGDLDLVALARQSHDAVNSALTAVRGFGRWTAEWFLEGGLGRGDVCPAGDLAVRTAFAHGYNRGREMSEEAIRRRSAAWGRHQNLVVHYLLAGQRRRGKTPGGGA